MIFSPKQGLRRVKGEDEDFVDRAIKAWEKYRLGCRCELHRRDLAKAYPAGMPKLIKAEAELMS